MLFWTRATLCIGTVTALAVGRLPPVPERAQAPGLVRPAAALVGEACRARPDMCAAALTGSLGSLGRPLAAPKPARRQPTVALGPRSLT